jgi:hypothetical protein
MTSSARGERSLNYVGTVGEVIVAGQFPKENYIVDDSRFDAEGDWAFCLFTSDQVYAARVGFTRGVYNFSDFGYVPAVADAYLLIHLQLMTREGAVLWLSTGHFTAEQVVTDSEKLDVRLVDGKQEIFSIQGWPRVHCCFRSDDGQAEADLVFELTYATLLPDNILPGNVFSMCEAIGRVSGAVLYQGRNLPVAGTVFYDHSRFKVQNNPVRPRQWHIYLPVVFEDESALISYYTVDNAGLPVEDYCFGLYIDAQGRSQWLPKAKLLDMKHDADTLPEAWILQLANEENRLDVEAAVNKTSILKAWGNWGASGAPQARRDFILTPLVVDGIGSLQSRDVQQKLRGRGLAEYWRMP